VRILDLTSAGENVFSRVTKLLISSFTHGWDTLEEAIAEVNESLEPGRLSRVAVDDAGDVLGWIGGIPSYGGNVWELHPLVVDENHRRQGIGRALVADLEERVRERGGVTVWLGSDDEDDATSLAGVDLYPNPLEHALRISNRRNHPFEFYQKCGYVIVGVLPDANGFGKPDIFLAKRVGKGMVAR
jgi:aminoglycoside 6'-N-acetyltransferase I